MGWRKRDRDKMGLRTTQRELEEKIAEKQKSNKDDLVETLVKKMSDMSDQLSELNKNVKELKDKEPTVVTIQGNGTETKKLEQKNKKIFIPSVDTKGMSVSAGQVQKRSRRIDISNAVDELSEMENDDA